MLHWSDRGTNELPDDCMWLQHGVLTAKQWQRDSWAKTRALQESVACHQSQLRLHSAELSSYPCDTLVIRYKSFAKRCAGVPCQRLPQTNTHASPAAMTTPPDYEGVRKRDWQLGDREKGRVMQEKQSRANRFSMSLIRQCGAVPPAVIHWK